MGKPIACLRGILPLAVFLSEHGTALEGPASGPGHTAFQRIIALYLGERRMSGFQADAGDAATQAMLRMRAG